MRVINLRSALKLTALLAALITLKILAAFILPFDSDEPQHMHVIWGWIIGQVQYRDFFDNHMPLFHMSMVPIMRGLGEDMRTLYELRLAMLAFYVGSLLALYELARSLYPPALARWALLAAAFFPMFFLISTQFRADDLWMLFWFACLAVLLAPSASLYKSLLAGVFLGAAFATSLKSILMLEAIAAAAAIMAYITHPKKAGVSWQRMLAFVAGCLVIPAFIAAYFSAYGILDDLIYCVMWANVASGLARRRLHNIPLLLLAMVVLIQVARRMPHTSRRDQAWLFLFLITACYWLLLYGTWPLITQQDFLPVQPLTILLLPPWLRAGQAWLSAHGCWSFKTAQAWRWLIGIEAVSIIIVLAVSEVNHVNEAQAAKLQAALSLTTSDQYVMDLKGETVFRRRPFYYVLEGITRGRLKRHELADTIAQDIIRTQTLVVMGELNFYPEQSRSFIAEHYLDIGNLRVTGQWLTCTGAQACDFEIVIPTLYALSSPQGPVSGMLDGRPYTGPRLLTPGVHHFVFNGATEPVAVIWARAWAKGFKPLMQATLPSINSGLRAVTALTGPLPH